MAGSGIGQGGAGGQPAMQASSGGKGGMGGQPATAAPAQGQYAPLAPQGDFNVNQASAGALQQSMQGAQAGMGFQAGQIMPAGYQASTAQATGYNPSTGAAAGYSPSAMTSRGYQAAGAGATGFNAANVGSQGYGATGAGSTGFDAANVGSRGYGATGTSATGYGAASADPTSSVNAQNVNAGQLANRDLSAYTNQYEDQVVQQTLSDLGGAQEQQLNQMGAQATAANAFGGSRQGIAEAETRKGFADKAAQAVSGLRQAGFTQAQQMAQQDIGTQQQAAMANQQANLQAGTTNAQFGQQTNLANQAASNQASQFGASAQNMAAQQTAAAQNAASQFGASAKNQAASQGANLQQAASQFGAGASNQASLQNAMASNQAAQFGASAKNQAASQGANLQQAASQFGAGASNQASLQNAMAANQARQFGSGAANQAASTNMAAQNAAGQFGANSQNQMTLSNMGAQNAAGQFGASAQNQMGLSNMGALKPSVPVQRGQRNVSAAAEYCQPDAGAGYAYGFWRTARTAWQSGISTRAKRYSRVRCSRASCSRACSRRLSTRHAGNMLAMPTHRMPHSRHHWPRLAQRQTSQPRRRRTSVACLTTLVWALPPSRPTLASRLTSSQSARTKASTFTRGTGMTRASASQTQRNQPQALWRKSFARRIRIWLRQAAMATCGSITPA